MRFTHIRLEVLTRRSMILALAFVANGAVRDASAQSAAPPVELGLDVSAFVPHLNGIQRAAPRSFSSRRSSSRMCSADGFLAGWSCR